MTVTVFVIPPPVNVIVPVLLAVPVLAVTSIANIALPVALAGEGVNHDALLVAVHDMSDVTKKTAFEDDAGADQDVIPNSSFPELAGAAACVTAIVLVIPPPVIVIVPLLPDVLVFAVAVNVSVPLLVPFAGETVSHDAALLEADHDTFDVTDTEVLPAELDGDQEEDDTTSDAGATVVPACATLIVLVIPPPVTVIIPALAAPVFSVTASAIEPLPFPAPPIIT